MRRRRAVPHGMGIVEWVVSFPAFLLLALGVVQVLLIAFHSLMLSYSAQEIARLISLQGIESGHRERAASQVLGWMWAKPNGTTGSVTTWAVSTLYPSPDYLRARAQRTVQINLISPTVDDLRVWTSAQDQRFLPPSPGETLSLIAPQGGKPLNEVSTVRVEVISVMAMSVPFVGRIMGRVMAEVRGCSALSALSEDCLFLQGKHPLNTGTPMLPIRRMGRSLLQPAIDLSRSSSLG